MLEQSVKNQLKDVFKVLKSEYTLQAKVNSEHTSKAELVELLEDLASCSEKINVRVEDAKGLSVTILKDGKSSNIIFRAVPTGHEFSSLLTAILNLDGIGKNLPDETLTKRIQNLQGKLEFKSYISLTCTNCPEVVKAINVMTALNPNITHEIIDGSINKEEVNALNVQAVPTVYLNGKHFHTGRAVLGELLDKAEKDTGTIFKVENAETKEYDVVVVGGGPAGASAAIYSVRKGLKVAIVAETIGGQVKETVSIENLISVPTTTGKDLSNNLLTHIKDYPVDVYENRRVAEAIVDEQGYKVLTTSFGEKFKTPAVIIATGASWRTLGVPGEKQYIGSGVAFCAHCDGPFYKDKKVVVIGGGNSGLEAAIDLSAIASEVVVLEFLDEFKGDQVLQDKIKETPNISTHTSAQTLSVEGDGNKVVALKYKDRNTEEEHEIATDGVFIQIGLSANSGVFADLVETNRAREIVVDSHCRTNRAGIYAAGDVSVVPYKQIIIAMGEGAKAALSAFDDKIKGKLLG